MSRSSQIEKEKNVANFFLKYLNKSGNFSYKIGESQPQNSDTDIVLVSTTGDEPPLKLQLVEAEGSL